MTEPMIETIKVVDTNTVFYALLDTDIEIYRITACRNILIHSVGLTAAIKTLTFDFSKSNLVAYHAYVESQMQTLYKHIADSFHELFEDINYTNDFLVNRAEVNYLLDECERYFLTCD